MAAAMKRFGVTWVAVALLCAVPGVALGSPAVQLPGTTAWYEGSAALGSYQAPDTVEAGTGAVPFASGYEAQTTTLRWSHASNTTGYTLALFGSDSQTITSATPDFLLCWWVDMQLHPTVVPGTTKKARTLAFAQSWDTSICGWHLFPAFALEGSDVSASQLSETGGSASSGGSFMLNNGVTMRFVRVYRGTWNPSTSKWSIQRRDNAYFSQLGRWASVAANDTQEKSGATLSPGFNTPYWYSSWPVSRTVQDASDVTNGITWAGTATAGNVLVTNVSQADALWASATTTALASWTGGETGEDAGGDDEGWFGSSFGGASDASGWATELQGAASAWGSKFLWFYGSVADWGSGS